MGSFSANVTGGAPTPILRAGIFGYQIGMLKGILWLVGLFLALALAGSVLVASSYVQWRGTTELPRGAELYDPSTQRFTAAGAHECSGRGTLVKAPSGAITLEGCGEGALEWNPTTLAFRKVAQDDGPTCGAPLQDGRQASVTTPSDAQDATLLRHGFRSQCRTLPTPRPVSADTLVSLPGERLFISGSTLAWSEQEWQRKDRFFAFVELTTGRWVELPSPPGGSAIEIVRAAAASPSQVFVATAWYVGDLGQEGPWQAWLLDLAARTWTPAPLPTGGPSASEWPGPPLPSLSEGVLLGIPAGVLLAKGQGNWSFSLATRAWSPVAPMLEPRSLPSSLVLHDGKVLFADGITRVARPRYDMGSAARFAGMVILGLAALGLGFYLSWRFQAPMWSRITAVVLSLMWTGLFALVLSGLSGMHGRPARTRGTGPRRLRQPRASFRARPNASPRAPCEASLREAFRWACDARLELASVTAFEELADALEALHAPSSLVERCHQAAAQESVHARLCTERVSALSPVELELTPLEKLPEESLSLEDTLATIACDSLADGCLGEGEAALSAKESAESSRDPQTRAVFETIARDEHAHAELAWSVLEYCLSHDLPAVRGAVTQTLAELPPPSGSPELLAQVTERARGLLRRSPPTAA